MSGMTGMRQADRSNAVSMNPSYLPNGDPGLSGGNTYSKTDTEPTLQDYENIFGPSGRDIKEDLQRFKRHGRWHLPDYLKGPNPWLTDRIDGLITDANNSPFTTKILPYRYKDEPDGEIQWNVWSFDEGLASRVPYEAAARTLTQSKRSFSGYMVRHGLAIVMEHNFLASADGRKNFQNQLNQLVGSIQYTNDLDVHMALILAPSYQRTVRERYFDHDKSPAQICREYVDLFGIMQKNANALDILIEEAKAILKSWGGPMPDFMLCNSKLTFQMTMTPEKTNYITQGPDGVRRLKQGPDLSSYRGLSVVHSRAFSMEIGQQPRDPLRRRVRTAEYHRIPPNADNVNRDFEFFDEEKDNWFSLSFKDLIRMARFVSPDGAGHDDLDDIYHALSGPATGAGTVTGQQGRGDRAVLGVLIDYENNFITSIGALNTATGNPFEVMFSVPAVSLYRRGSPIYVFSACPCDLGFRHIEPRTSEFWTEWLRLYETIGPLNALKGTSLEQSSRLSMTLNGRLTPAMTEGLYEALKDRTLNDPFDPTITHAPETSGWFRAYTFYISTYRRCGVPVDYLRPVNIGAAEVASGQALSACLGGLTFRDRFPDRNQVNLGVQLLSEFGTTGSVNEPGNFWPNRAEDLFFSDAGVMGQNNRAYCNDVFHMTEPGELLAWKTMLCFEAFEVLLSKVSHNGKVGYFYEIVPEIIADFVLEIDLAAHVPWHTLCDALLSDNTRTNGLISAAIIEYLLIRQMRLLVENNVITIEATSTKLEIAQELARRGIDTLNMCATTTSRLDYPGYANNSRPIEMMKSTYGYVNLEVLKDADTPFDFVSKIMARNVPRLSSFTDDFNMDGYRANVKNYQKFVKRLASRMHVDYRTHIYSAIQTGYLEDVRAGRVAAIAPGVGLQPDDVFAMEYLMPVRERFRYFNRPEDEALNRQANEVTSFVCTAPNNISVDLRQWRGVPQGPPRPPAPPGPGGRGGGHLAGRAEDVEIVVIRPNIEHNMLGVVMGLGGNELGNTLWGQTELSVYDDSMHGIWGMSYKYHERAMVFNEKNLIRLWDIAYDGYNGGKDDTYVDWTNPNARRNGWREFQERTLDISKNYHGPSMMVLAFVHDRTKMDANGGSVFDANFKRNWPSPIVFHDKGNDRAGRPAVPVDYDNIQVIDVDEFRVFNNELYRTTYNRYKDMMPDFHEMHLQRKSAGQASIDAETPTDSLAFQGTMRIKKNGMLIQEIAGSGHHGPDYTGVASVRGGKGLKAVGGISNIVTLK